jgi:hypothetical protein
LFLLVDYIFFFSYTWVLFYPEAKLLGVMKRVFSSKNACKLIFIIAFFTDTLIAYESIPKVTLRFTRILRAFAMSLYSKDLRRNMLGILIILTNERNLQVFKEPGHLIPVLFHHHRSLGFHWVQLNRREFRACEYSTDGF